MKKCPVCQSDNLAASALGYDYERREIVFTEVCLDCCVLILYSKKYSPAGAVGTDLYRRLS